MPNKPTGGRDNRSSMTGIRKRSTLPADANRCRACGGKLDDAGTCGNCAFEGALVARAEAGDVDAAREILRTLVNYLDHNAAGPMLSYWLSNALLEYLDRGVALEKALRLVPRAADRPGGRSESYDSAALAALYTLLRDRGTKAEAAMKLMNERLGVSRMTMQRVRKDYNGIDELLRDNPERRQRVLVAMAARYLPELADMFDSAD